MVTYLRFNPGDIVSEWMRSKESARYIVIDKREVEDFRNQVYVLWETVIIYVKEEWNEYDKPGDKWIIDEESVCYEAHGAIRFEIEFKSPLSWK